MDDLGEERLVRRPRIEDLLALEVESAALAGHMREPRGAIFGVDAVRALLRHARVLTLVTPDHSPHPVGTKLQHPRDADRLGWHRLAAAPRGHQGGQPDADREAQRLVYRCDRQRPQSRVLGRDPPYWRPGSPGTAAPCSPRRATRPASWPSRGSRGRTAP